MFDPVDLKPHKAVIFDWGGVLMRTVNYEPRHRWDRALNLPEGSVENIVHGSKAWIQAERGKISPDEYWSAIGKQLHLSPNQLADFRCDFYSGDGLDESLLALIASLRSRSVKIGLLSNNSLELLDTIRDSQLGGKLDAVVVSAQIGIRKPDPRVYRAILTQIGVLPSEALYIDDSRTNAEGALAVGMAAVHFETTTKLGPLIEHWLKTGRFASTVKNGKKCSQIAGLECPLKAGEKVC